MSRRGLKSVALGAGCGYGDATCAYLAGLDALGIPVSWQPIDGDLASRGTRSRFVKNVPEAIRPQLNKLWQRSIEHDAALISIPPIQWHKEFLEREVEHRRFCYATWELERLPPSWASVFNHFDGIFVPSNFNARTFRTGGVNTPISVIPHVARAALTPASRPNWLAQLEGLYVFYTIGTWTSRKGMEDTVRAYLSSFKGNDDVCLVIKTDALDLIKSEFCHRDDDTDRHCAVWYTLAKVLADYPDPARIHLIAKRVPATEIDALHARGDCYVSLTHSEGWGLGAFDALQFSTPVIMPGYGGQMDYLGEQYPLLVRHTMEPVNSTPSDGYFEGMEQEEWGRACPDHAGELMRMVYEDRDTAAELGRKMQQAIVTDFSPHRICTNLASKLGLSQS